MFETVYVEKACQNSLFVKKLKPQNIIEIEHYKDIFNRYNQDFFYQKKHPKLILACQMQFLQRIEATFVQNYASSAFYANILLGCIYDCAYCFLGGMYPSAYLVLFENFEQLFAQLDALEGHHFVALNYESDLLALEPYLGIVETLSPVLTQFKNIDFEVRTKSVNAANLPFFPDNFIYGFSILPQEVIDFAEHKTPKVEARVKTIKACIKRGARVRLCFDPIVKCERFYEVYETFFHQLFKTINPKDIYDCTIGAVRMNTDYLKRLQVNRADEISFYPYRIEKAQARYEDEVQIVAFVREILQSRNLKVLENLGF